MTKMHASVAVVVSPVLLALVAGGFLSFGPEGGAAAATKPPAKWPDEVFRRFSVDIHVPDWDPALLSRFDGEEFVETLARGGVQSMCSTPTRTWACACGGPRSASGTPP